jgi:hypothetical protein
LRYAREALSAAQTGAGSGTAHPVLLEQEGRDWRGRWRRGRQREVESDAGEEATPAQQLELRGDSVAGVEVHGDG